MSAETLDPNFYHAPETFGPFQWPPRPLSVTGFVFSPAARIVDFSAVPGFSLGRLRFIQHLKTGRILYGRPIDPPGGLAKVDGVPVPPPPTSGKVLTLKADCAGMLASDEIVAAYDPAPGG